MMAAAHQPNFFPWLGYFSKIARADTFIFLDHVPFPRTSRGNWVNRTRVISNGEARWLTCPIQTSSRGRIDEARIDFNQTWRPKALRTLEKNYRTAPHFVEVIEWVGPLIDSEIVSLCDYNIENIQTISARLNLSCNFLRQSEIWPPREEEATGSERLASLCHYAGCDQYLAGDGAAGYENIDTYEEKGIGYVKNNYAHPIYAQQVSEFIPGMSILDALFNVGAEATRALVDADRPNAL